MKNYIWFLFVFSSLGFCSTGQFIFNIAHEIPLEDNIEPLKNFYINMGRNQGIGEGTVLNVYRVISRVDPYKTKKHHNFKVKVGEIKVLHFEDEASIAVHHPISADSHLKELYFDVDGIMMGDHISVKVE